MPQQTENLPTTDLIRAGETLARLGLDCPWVGEGAWADLENNMIRGVDAFDEEGQPVWFHCPPAVAAAVVDCSLKLWKWDHLRAIHFHSEKTKGMDYSARIDRMPFPRLKPIDLEAAAALIIAVADAVGEGD